MKTHTPEELPLRCPFCGDSQKSPDKKHFSINLVTGLYHCYRCGVSGKLTPKTLQRFPQLAQAVLHSSTATWFMLSKESPTSTFLESFPQKILPGPGSPRKSGLDRFHLTTDSERIYDLFLSRALLSPKSIRGLHLRGYPQKTMITIGKRMMGFSDKLDLKSPITVVEGPYDVIDPQHDVCLFGLPTKQQVAEFQGLTVILCPDGDLWYDPKRLAIFIEIFHHSCIFVKGVIHLPHDKDPDQVPISERKILTLGEARKWLHRKSEKRDPLSLSKVLQELENRSLQML